MAAEWYLKIAGKEVGPLSSQQLRSMASKGQLAADDLVRQGGEGAWVTANRVKGLLPAAGSASADADSAVMPKAKPLAADTDSKTVKVTAKPTSSSGGAKPAARKKPEVIKRGEALDDQPETPPEAPPVAVAIPIPPAPPPPPVVPTVVPVPVPEPVEEIPANPRGITLPFDVSPPLPHVSSAPRAAAKATSAGGVKVADAKKSGVKINPTVITVAVIVVVAGILSLVVMNSGGDSKGRGKNKPAAEAEAAAADAAKKAEEEKKKKDKEVSLDSMFDLAPKDKDGKTMALSAKDTKSGDAKPGDGAEKPAGADEKWLDAAKDPYTGEHATIKVISAKIEKPDRNSKAKARLREDVLAVVLEIANTIKERELKPNLDLLSQKATAESMMTDNFNNPRPLMGNILATKSSIDPEEKATVTLCFKKPFKTVTYVHLKIPGAAFEEKADVKFEIPKSMFASADDQGDDKPEPEETAPAQAEGPPPAERPKPRPKNPEDDIPPLNLPEPDARLQPVREAEAEVAAVQPAVRKTAVREQRVTDFDDDPALVEQHGRPKARRDADRRDGRRVAKR